MMNIILLVKNMRRPVKIHLTRPRAVLLMALFCMPVALAAYAGFFWGAQSARVGEVVEASAAAADGSECKQVTRELREHIKALAARLGTLQAHVIRLDAVGRRLVDLAGLVFGVFFFFFLLLLGGLVLVLVFVLLLFL